MIEIKGRFNTAKCFTDEMEEFAAAQIRLVCDQEVFAGAKLRIMPDVHAGKGCTIGTTMTLKDKVVPGMVGVDIGCGWKQIWEVMEALKAEGSFRKEGNLYILDLNVFGRKFLPFRKLSGPRPLSAPTAARSSEALIPRRKAFMKNPGRSPIGNGRHAAGCFRMRGSGLS